MAKSSKATMTFVANRFSAMAQLIDAAISTSKEIGGTVVYIECSKNGVIDAESVLRDVEILSEGTDASGNCIGQDVDGNRWSVGVYEA